MSSAQPWQQQPGWPGAPAPPPPPPPPGGGGKGPTPWIIGLISVLALSVVLSVATDNRSLFGDSSQLPGDYQDLENIDPDDFDPNDLDGFDPNDLDDFDLGGLEDLDDFDADTSGGSDSAGPGGAPDPQLEAFAGVQAGDCLENYDTGDGWNAEQPIKADCGTDEGIMFVTSVRSTQADCDIGAGLAYWAYTGTGGESIALCLTRQFHENYCMLGTTSGGEVTDANLLSLVDCYADSLPGKWNEVMQITAVYQAPDEIYDGACALYEGDQNSYYYWLVDNDEVLLCSRIYPR